MANTRIKDLVLAESMGDSDFLVFDGESSGTKKITKSALLGSIESQIGAIEDEIGDTALPTTAQTLTGAIAEHENGISELNSNLTNLFKVVQYSYTYDIGANASLSISATQLEATAPQGYSAIAMSRISTGKLDVIARNFNPSASGNTGMINLRNISANAITGGLLEITITYALTSSLN